jgi:hypothetical protein
VERQELTGICSRLEALLEQSNAQAQVLFGESEALLAAGLSGGFALLRQKVEQFEYEEALQALRQAAKEQGLILSEAMG